MTLIHVYALVSISLIGKPDVIEIGERRYLTRDECLEAIRGKMREPGVVMILDRAALVCVQTTKESKP